MNLAIKSALMLIMQSYVGLYAFAVYLLKHLFVTGRQLTFIQTIRF